MTFHFKFSLKLMWLLLYVSCLCKKLLLCWYCKTLYDWSDGFEGSGEEQFSRLLLCDDSLCPFGGFCISSPDGSHFCSCDFGCIAVLWVLTAFSATAINSCILQIPNNLKKLIFVWNCEKYTSLILKSDNVNFMKMENKV